MSQSWRTLKCSKEHLLSSYIMPKFHLILNSFCHISSFFFWNKFAHEWKNNNYVRQLELWKRKENNDGDRDKKEALRMSRHFNRCHKHRHSFTTYDLDSLVSSWIVVSSRFSWNLCPLSIKSFSLFFFSKKTLTFSSLKSKLGWHSNDLCWKFSRFRFL